MNAVWFFIGFAAACVVVIAVLSVLIRKMEKAIRQDYEDEWDDEEKTCELCEHERAASNMPPCDMCKHNYPEHFKAKKEEVNT